MALTQVTTSGLANGAVTSSKISNTVQLGGPTISQIQITDSSYNVLDDTAVDTSGGYIKITGTGFAAGAIVVIGSTNATSTAFVSSTVLNVQVPALSAGTYTVYVVNTNGGTAIGVNGLTYSALPSWVTGSTLPNGLNNTPISIQLSATDATSYVLQTGSTLPSGLTLSGGGLLSGTVTVGVETVYAFTVVAIDAQAQDSPRAFTITIIVGDPYFYLTTFLLPGNGTNNGTNNTFADSSTNAYTVTRYGNATQGTASPFSLTGWSNYFDGTGDYLTVADNAALQMGSGNFTIEYWWYPNSIANYQNPIDKGYTGTGALLLQTGNGDGRIIVYASGSAVITASTAVTVNAWNHMALVRNGTSLVLYLNGVSVGSATNSTNFNSTATLGIGATATAPGGGGVGSFPIVGYLSNLRFVKGTAVYTAAFTPPTAPLTAITNTSLLTSQSNRFIDNSANNFTITRTGDVSVQSFSPFAPGSTYSAAAVGGSTYFDGTGDYLSTVNTPANVGSNNFTFETWIWFTTSSAGYQPIIMNTGGGDYQGWVLITETTNILWFLSSTNGSSWTNTINTGVIPTTNCWTHIAVVRNGSTITYYINGVASGTNNIGASSINTPSGAFYVGYYPYFPGGARSFNGYFSGTRLVNGTAVYTSNFTPPTAPLTNIANTSLLLNYTNGQITDATSKNDLETLGDAKISTTQSKWGGSSMYFDGTGDYLKIPNSQNFNFGSGNFTVECWVYCTNTTPTQSIFATPANGSGFAGLLFEISSGNTRIVSSWTGSWDILNANTGSISANTWTHFAIVRNGGTLTVYKNGTSTYTNSGLGTSSLVFGTTEPATISYGRINQGDARYFYGYINDFRITKGYARYTANFTPPTSAFPTL